MKKNKISCIYKIICKNNNKFYIGSSININIRLNQHIRLLKRNKHKNKYLQKSWNKYGEKNFRFEIMETVHDINQLLTREKWWIDTTDCCNRKIGFNISINPIAPNTGRFIDLTGQNFGRLTPIKHIGKNEWGHSQWLCRCSCGKEKIILGNSLRRGLTKSCGCLHNEGNNFKHGHSQKDKISRTYQRWQNIIDRCSNPNNASYENYNKIKIKICYEWSNKENGFKNFLKDMGECPGKEYSIYKINNNLGYYKENCRWVKK